MAEFVRHDAEDGHGAVHNFGADAVAAQERNVLFHLFMPPYPDAPSNRAEGRHAQ